MSIAHSAVHRGRWVVCVFGAFSEIFAWITVPGCGGEVEEWVIHDAAGLGGTAGTASFSSESGGAASDGGATTSPENVGGSGGGSGSASRTIIVCPGGKRVAVTGPACGDGLIDPGEKCDDGNVNSGDGCSSRCLVEPGWTCPDARSPCLSCGNCQLEPGETCDDGNAHSGDGCSDRCQVEVGFRCDIPLHLCVSTGTCGDGEVTVVGESCDDRNTRSGDGCSADCKTVEPGFLCSIPGESCQRVTATQPHCGDGVVQADQGETCDDGSNDGRYGGCSADCMRPVCGDGQVQPRYGEVCDEGRNNGGSYLGCTSDCQYTPIPEPVDCTRFRGPSCGDGELHSEFGETCDDGINDGMNGRCGPDCTSGRAGFCGDAIVNSVYEECDDGNWTSCDGCSSRCQSEMSP
jgi:cysteine-rich repeat protein